MADLSPEVDAHIRNLVSGQVAEAVRVLESKITTWVNSHEEVHKAIKARFDLMARTENKNFNHHKAVLNLKEYHKSPKGIAFRDWIQGSDSGVAFGDRMQGSDSGVAFRDRVQG